jgi:hypothetical protein
VEVPVCLKPALKHVHEIRIKRQRRYRAIGFRIQRGLKTSYARAGREVKKLSGRCRFMPHTPNDYSSSAD